MLLSHIHLPPPLIQPKAVTEEPGAAWEGDGVALAGANWCDTRQGA